MLSVCSSSPLFFHTPHYKLWTLRYFNRNKIQVPVVTYIYQFKDFDLLSLLGLRTEGFIDALILPLFLTAVLFLGPITSSIFDGSWRGFTSIFKHESKLYQSIYSIHFDQVWNAGRPIWKTFSGFGTNWWLPFLRSLLSVPAWSLNYFIVTLPHESS